MKNSKTPSHSSGSDNIFRGLTKQEHFIAILLGAHISYGFEIKTVTDKTLDEMITLVDRILAKTEQSS